MFCRTVLAVLLSTLAGVAQAQTQPPAAPAPDVLMPSRPSVPTGPSTASTPGSGEVDPVTGNIGPARGVVSTPSPNSRDTTSGRPRSPAMLGGGSFGPPVGNGLENAVNSGTPPAWDRKAGVRKVCPPELE